MKQSVERVNINYCHICGPDDTVLECRATGEREAAMEWLGLLLVVALCGIMWALVRISQRLDTLIKSGGRFHGGNRD